MVKQKNDIWWKTLIVLTLITSIICLFLLLGKCNVLPQYEYETKLIELDNDNTIEYFDGVIVDYLCDEGVATYLTDKSSFYASTWEYSAGVKQQYKGMYGRCLVKIKTRVK